MKLLMLEFHDVSRLIFALLSIELVRVADQLMLAQRSQIPLNDLPVVQDDSRDVVFHGASLFGTSDSVTSLIFSALPHSGQIGFAAVKLSSWKLHRAQPKNQSPAFIAVRSNL